MKVELLEQKPHLQKSEIEGIIAGVQKGRADLKARRVKPAEEVFSRLEKKYQDMQH